MMAYIQIIIDFLLGEPTTALDTLFLFTVINAVLGVVVAKDRKVALSTEWKRPVVYLLFYVIAHRLDALLIDNLFDWKGSTKVLVVLGLIAKDIRQILTRAGEWSGQFAPGVLLGRLDQMERGDVTGEFIDGRVLDQKIDNLRQNLEKLKELNRLKQEMNKISGTEELAPKLSLITEISNPGSSTETPGILLEPPNQRPRDAKE